MANATNDQRQNVVKSEWALHAGVKMTKQPDEQRFHCRDGERVALQKHSTIDTGGGVNDSENGPKCEDRVEDGPKSVGWAQIYEQVADEDADPADFYRNVLGSQFPAHRHGSGHEHSRVVDGPTVSFYGPVGNGQIEELWLGRHPHR